MTRLLFALLLLTGCFREHGAGDAPTRDGGLPPDGGAWTTCRAADEGGGREGDPCTFSERCFGDGPCRGTTTSCVDGRLHIEHMVDEGCPTSCADLVEGSDPSGRACETDFGTCTIAVDACCIASFRCEGGFVVQVGASACDTECGGTELCGSGSPPPPEAVVCTGDSDCDSSAGAYCLPPGEDPGCGVCSVAERDCESSADCPDATHCEEYEPPCSSCDGSTPSACVEDCVPGGCPDRQQCVEGACVPLRCDTGAIECPQNFRCDGTTDDGCARLTCTLDTDCDCGSCVSGRCYPGPGTCELPRA